MTTYSFGSGNFTLEGGDEWSIKLSELEPFPPLEWKQKGSRLFIALKEGRIYRLRRTGRYWRLSVGGLHALGGIRASYDPPTHPNYKSLRYMQLAAQMLCDQLRDQSKKESSAR